MDISLKNVGKKFRKTWIFRGIDHDFSSRSKCVILGPNGSGKSTLLLIISSMTMPSEGEVSFSEDGQILEPSQFYSHFSIAAPYMSLMEKLTLNESLEMHRRFKAWSGGLQTSDLPEILGLQQYGDQVISEFSSGMKQRLKLGLALLSDVSVVLLDEPTSNLDKAAKKWYLETVTEWCMDKMLVVCSNHVQEEYDFCTEQLVLAG